MERIVAEYVIETPDTLAYAAETIAGEQSTGAFVAVPGETEALKRRFRARVESIEFLEDVETPSLTGARPRGEPPPPWSYQRGRVRISFPLESIGTQLTSVVTAIAGNLYELSSLSGVKLLDIELPDSFMAKYPGPAFGITGTRELTGVQRGPWIGSVIKPNVGLTPQQTAKLVKVLAEADIDVIKDDELMADPPHSPFDGRVKSVMDVINRSADRSGKKAMYAFNISDEIDVMLRRHDAVLEAGGTCVMVNLNSVGLGAVMRLRRHSQLPIHGHRSGWGMWARHPYLGMSFKAYQKIWRVAGVDHIHVNGLQNKYWESDDSVVESIQSCLEPFLGWSPVLPVVSSGQWGGQAPETYRRVQCVDLMYLAGGGIMAHPGGPAAGVRALRQCWEAAVEGIPLQQYAQENEELRHTLEAFGPVEADS